MTDLPIYVSLDPEGGVTIIWDDADPRVSELNNWNHYDFIEAIRRSLEQYD